MAKTITQWADLAVAGILSKGEQAAAKQELLDHMEDHMADLMAAGFSREDAEKHAVFAMGDPEETAKLLRKAHQPILTRILQMSQWLLALALIILLGAIFTRIGSLRLDDFGLLEKEPTPAEELAPLFSPDSLNDIYDSYNYLQLVEPGNSLKKNGYTFTVTQAAICGQTQGDFSRYRCQIVLCLEVTRDSRFMPWPELPGDWMMVTENGNRSLSYGHDRSTETGILHGFHQNDQQYFIRLSGWFPQDSRWVDLTYFNGERDFTLRVDLEGGTEYAR